MHGNQSTPAGPLLSRLFASCAGGRGARRWAGLCALALSAGCGGASGPAIDIQFASAALLADTAALELRVYRRGSDCDVLRSTRPRPEALVGPLSFPLEPTERETGKVILTEAIPAGTFVFLLDALDDDGASAGAGCAAEAEVRDGETSTVIIRITDD